MSRLIIVLQEKGGVGKTFLAVHLTSFLHQLGHIYRPVDFDLTAGLLTKVFPKPASASISPDVGALRSGESRLPELMERAMKGELFLVDSGANTGAAWQTLFSETYPSLQAELDEHQIKTTLIVPVTSDEKTTFFFEHYKALFPKATVIMVVVREFRDEQFLVPAHPAGLTIDLPLAPPKLFTTYRTRAMAVDAIANSADAALSMDRAFARGYLPQLHASFRKIQPHLLP